MTTSRSSRAVYPGRKTQWWSPIISVFGLQIGRTVTLVRPLVLRVHRFERYIARGLAS